jgi:hypothetical protein
MSSFRVACLGWGSLLWDPRTLPMAEPFRADGPRLPIEFSRVAMDGRVTLVIDPRAKAIQTYRVRMDVDDLDAAIRQLSIREKISSERHGDWIGVQTRASSAEDTGVAAPEVRSAIAGWLSNQPYDAVVWTALPARAPDGRFEYPSQDSLVSHLQSLSGPALVRAEEYIRRAPDAVRTPNRKRFEEVFGWSSAAVGDHDPERGSSDG